MGVFRLLLNPFNQVGPFIFNMEYNSWREMGADAVGLAGTPMCLWRRRVVLHRSSMMESWTRS